ncbi:MAG: hypothetical protein KKB50_04630 [Planctomycetes bacterium]|nr:hypothetical protein [Planctomycetota bacterium]
MNAARVRLAAPLLVITALVGATLPAQTRPAPVEQPAQTPESVVNELYGLVTFKVGTAPDWQKVRALFIDEAVVVLRTARDKMTVFSVQGFVDDFVRFIESARARERGFTEKIVHMQPTVYGDIAHVLVLYEASLNDSVRPPTRGLDSFQLIRKGSEWKIVSITNELVTAARPLPPGLRE